MRWSVPILLALAVIAPTHAAPGDRLNFVLYSDGATSSYGSGHVDDFTSASRYRSGKAPMLYVREGGSAYVIRDAAILARAQAIMAPQRALGERQGALGRQQGELGRRQGKLGAEQGRLGAQMAHANPRRVSEIARQQAELGRQQSALGVEQSALGARQSDLGRQQSRQAEIAEPKLRALVAEAVRSGLAQRVD